MSKKSSCFLLEELAWLNYCTSVHKFDCTVYIEHHVHMKQEHNIGPAAGGRKTWKGTEINLIKRELIQLTYG